MRGAGQEGDAEGGRGVGGRSGGREEVRGEVRIGGQAQGQGAEVKRRGHGGRSALRYFERCTIKTLSTACPAAFALPSPACSPAKMHSALLLSTLSSHLRTVSHFHWVPLLRLPS